MHGAVIANKQASKNDYGVQKQLKSLRIHCTITGVKNVKQVSFKSGQEDCYKRSRSDKIWQTVPDTCTGIARSPTVGSRVRLTIMTINDEDELERSR